MDDDTMDYVQLWDYIQGMKHFEKIISPEDIILLNELVEGQNFQIALDLLRHRIRPCLKHLPVEIADIARPKKCIKVQPPPFSEEQQPPSLDAFRAFMQTSSLTPFTSLAQNAMSIPPPPPQGTQRNENIYRTSVGSIVPSASSASNNEEDHYIVEENYTSEAFERQKRQELREQQDLEYILSMIADSIKEEKQEANNNEQFEDITNDTKQNDASLNDAPFLKTQTQNEQSKHKKRSPQKTIEIEEPPSPNNPQAVLILVSIPAQGKRLERHFLTTNTLFDISKWVTRELNDGQDNDDGHVFFTNFPKREWKLSDVLQNLPIERKKLLLLVE